MSFGRSCACLDAPKQLSYASASRFDTMLDSGVIKIGVAMGVEP